MGLGTMEIVLIAAVIVLLFGAKKLPELARSLGDSAKELRKGLNDDPAPVKVATKADTTNE